MYTKGLDSITSFLKSTFQTLIFKANKPPYMKNSANSTFSALSVRFRTLPVSLAEGLNPSALKRGCLGYDIKQHVGVKLQIWSSGKCYYLFLIITLRPTQQTQTGSACLGPIYEPNRFVRKSFVLDRNTWYQITVCKNLLRKCSKNININVQWTWFSNI